MLETSKPKALTSSSPERLGLVGSGRSSFVCEDAGSGRRAFDRSKQLKRYWVVSKMAAVASCGMSHIGKWPLCSNQCRVADGNAALARAAWAGRHNRSCLPHPIKMRCFGSAAGPRCSGPLARSSTRASNVGVSVMLVSSVQTSSGESAVGFADSWANSMVRAAALRLIAGKCDRRVRSSRADRPMVIRKKERSQPRQNPPGSSATAFPTFPRRANSSTIRAPIELPTASTPTRLVSTRNCSTLATRPSKVPLSGLAGVEP